MPAIMDEEHMSVASSATIKEEEESESVEDSPFDDEVPTVASVPGPSAPAVPTVAGPSVPSPTTPWSRLRSEVPVVEGPSVPSPTTPWSQLRTELPVEILALSPSTPRGPPPAEVEEPLVFSPSTPRGPPPADSDSEPGTPPAREEPNLSELEVDVSIPPEGPGVDLVLHPSDPDSTSRVVRLRSLRF